MVVTVFDEPIRRRYRAPVCSMSFCFSALVLAGAVLVPFFVGFASENFWLKTNTYFAQPTLRFQYDVLLLLQGEAGADGHIATWAWATDELLRDAYEPHLRPTVVRAWADDDNLDGVADVWTVTLQMPLEANDKVFQVSALAFFDYSLNGRAALDMDAVAYVEHASGVPGTGLLVEAEARLHQRRPLSVRRTNADPSLRFAARTQPASLRPNAVGAVVSSYAKRNFTMGLSNQYKVWTTAASADPYSPVADSFCVNFTLRVPTDQVTYTPDVAEVLKVAWIQYFALACLFYALFFLLKSFVYTNQVLETIVETEAASAVAPFSKKQHNF